MCQIGVSYGKSLIIDFLDNFLKKRTDIMHLGDLVPKGLFGKGPLILEVLYASFEALLLEL